MFLFCLNLAKQVELFYLSIQNLFAAVVFTLASCTFMWDIPLSHRFILVLLCLQHSLTSFPLGGQYLVTCERISCDKALKLMSGAN